MNAATLAIKIVSDTAGAVKGMRDVETSGGRMGKALHTGANVAKVGVLALGAAMVSGAKAAAEDEKSQALLANSMVKAAGATDAQIASTEKWIDSTARASGVADDQLRPALANLVRATGSVTESQKAMGVAMDVSAATGKPLEAVSAALSKAYAGNTTSLGRLVPGLDKATVQSGDMNAIMKELARTTGGAMATAANTTEGKVARMNVAFGEAKETLGVALLPALTLLAEKLVVVAEFVQNNQTTVMVLVGVFGTLAVAVIIINALFSAYTAVTTVAAAATGGKAAATTADAAATTAQTAATTAGNLSLLTRAGIMIRVVAATIAHTVAVTATRTAVMLWTAAQWLLNAALLANPLGLFIIAVLAVVAAFVLAYQKSEAFRNVVQAVCKAVISFFQPVITKVQELWKWITNGESVAQHAKDVIVGAFKAMTAPIRTVINLVKDLISWLGKLDLGKLSSAGLDWGGLGGAGGAPRGWSPPADDFGRGGPGDGLFGLGGRGQGTVMQFIFNGPIDSDAAAREIEKLLRSRGIRLGAAL